MGMCYVLKSTLTILQTAVLKINVKDIKNISLCNSRDKESEPWSHNLF